MKLSEDEKVAFELDEKRKISDDWMNKLIDKQEVKEFLIKKILFHKTIKICIANFVYQNREAILHILTRNIVILR